MSTGKTDKPRIKGLVKRCRSFKEDILSRLARNRSLGKEDGGSSASGGSSSRRLRNTNSPGNSHHRHCSSTTSEGGTSPVPGCCDHEYGRSRVNGSSGLSPQVSISHRLKEAYLTLQFVESLIKKDCVDLLGGSSNVMLDCMGCLLSDVKKSAVSDSSTYQSATSQVKIVLSDFLTAIDILLLEEGQGQGSESNKAHREICFEKILETLNGIKTALDRLQNLINVNLNVNLNLNGNGHGHKSTGSSTTTTTGSSPSLLLTPNKVLETESPAPPAAILPDSTPKRPPLPPKLKQWKTTGAKSFDFDLEYPSSPISPFNSNYEFHNVKGQNPESQPFLLSQWLEESSGGGNFQHHYSTPIPKEKGQWQDSTIYEQRNQKSGNIRLHLENPEAEASVHRGTKSRTMSDSHFYGVATAVGASARGSQESLDDTPGTGTGTSRSHCSCQSLSQSLGSSMDNLLLVDSGSAASGEQRQHSPKSPLPQSSTCFYTGELEGDVFIAEVSSEPPQLPQKKSRQFILGIEQSSQNPRCPSPYDNVEHEHGTWHGETSAAAKQSFQSQHKQFMSYSESRHTLVGVSAAGAEDRPPLPPKKKHSITAYVEFLHNFDTSTATTTAHHHSSYSNVQLTQNGAGGMVPKFPGNGTSGHPGCYPNRSYTHCGSYQHFASFSSTGTAAAAAAAYRCTEEEEEEFEDFSSTNPIAYQQIFGTSSFDSEESSTTPSLVNVGPQPPAPALPPKRGNLKHSVSQYDEGIQGMENCFIGRENQNPEKLPAFQHTSPTHSLPPPTTVPAVVAGAGSLTPRHGNGSLDSPESSAAVGTLDQENPDLFLLDVEGRLVPNESLNQGKVLDGPLIKGGEPNILMVYAAMPELQDIKFREVFLLTYRTFSPPFDVICLLWKRFQYFESRSGSDRTAVMNRRSTLDLFVDVICSLTPMDLETPTIGKIRSCIYHLVNIGEVHLALRARKGLLEKFDVRLKLLAPKPVPVSLAVTTEPSSLIRWGASTIAQQMTLLDAELFRQLEPAELLLWAREQQEDFCPALNNFTDHFNKVSYWARSKVLLCSSSRERNRTMKKLIEVMRKLRDYNNFNSLLAVLAALDSAPIRRLGFSKRLTEALKPHAVLTDSSGSFRTYRQALSESKPPCIPYLGLVLQDLTFVHIGNADFLPDGKVNWLKRWQQCVVLEPIRRFHKCNYGFSRNDALLSFLNNFDESLNDDDLWQLSEAIKPRGKT